MPDMNAKENKEIVDQGGDDRKVNEYTPAGKEIGKKETEEDHEQADKLLASLEKDQPKSSKKQAQSGKPGIGREQQTKTFSQNYPDKRDRIPAANNLVKILQQSQTGNPLGRAFQWLSQKILGPQNT